MYLGVKKGVVPAGPACRDRRARESTGKLWEEGKAGKGVGRTARQPRKAGASWKAVKLRKGGKMVCETSGSKLGNAGKLE